MKKTISKLSLLSLSLFLCACGSSAPKEDAGTSGETESETAAEVSGNPLESEDISAESITVSSTEKENQYGYKSIVVTLTNNTSYIVLSPEITFKIRDGVSKEEMEAALPEGVEVDIDQLEVQRKQLYPNYSQYSLNPSGTSPGLEIRIPVIQNDVYQYDTCLCTQQMFDLMEVENIHGILVVDGHPKLLSVHQSSGFPEEPGIPADMLPDYDILLNQISEEIKDRVVIPDGASLYTCKQEKNYDDDGSKLWRIVFYDVDKDAMTQCINTLKELYTVDPYEFNRDYSASDEDGNGISMDWNEDLGTLSEFFVIK